MAENSHTLEEQEQKEIEQALRETAKKISEVAMKMLERNSRKLPVYTVYLDVSEISSKDNMEEYTFKVLKHVVENIILKVV